MKKEIINEALENLKNDRRQIIYNINLVLENEKTTNYIKTTSLHQLLHELALTELKVETLKKHFYPETERT